MRWTKVLCIIICLLLLIGMVYFISIRKGDKEASLAVSNKTETVATVNEKETLKAKEEEKAVKSEQKEKTEENPKANEQNEQSSLVSTNKASKKEEAKKSKEEAKEENLSLKNKENIIQKAKAIFQREKKANENPQKEDKNKNLKEQNEKEAAKEALKEKVEIKIKEILSLNKIEFETGKSSLTKKGKEIVSKIAVILKEYPNLKIEIAGHTDNTGDETMNKKLSEERAKSVKDELIKLGIDPNRLIAKGYGSSKPLQKTDGKSQANRRVEFIVIGE